MKNFITKENLKERLIQLIILIAHLILLYWILYTLHEGGILPFKTVLLHFLGISVYGAVLIRTCAYIYHRQYMKEQSENSKNLGK
ncbi:MAG: hypothetical protein AB7I27_12020 [Bacteriovoracaceae bacterium]